ncbi:MAG: DUF4342 domain-containing protein [Chloroflexi bacterium]|nr:DUF4342 domain-containing protein [Chloroflexota bacterium]
MSDEEKIYVDEDETTEEETVKEGNGTEWTEEFVVAGEELLGTVKNLVKETAVRHIEIINEKHDIHFKIPLAVGVVGIFFLGWWAAVALIAALVTDCTIRVVRVEPAPEEKEPEDVEVAAA